MQTLSINDIFNALSSFTTENLRAINSEVVSTLNNRIAMESRVKMRNFKVGDLAEFTSIKGGKLVRIRITKFNTKTVSGKEVSRHDNTDTIGTWRVSAHFLTAV